MNHNHILTRQEFLDYAHSLINMYETMWNSQIKGQHRNDDEPHQDTWTALELISLSPENVQERYTASLLRYPGRGGFRILAHEHSSSTHIRRQNMEVQTRCGIGRSILAALVTRLLD